MKLWILEPTEAGRKRYWTPWYDKCFAMVVRAETESDARELAALDAQDEGGPVWRDPDSSTCVPLTDAGEPGVIMQDVHHA